MDKACLLCNATNGVESVRVPTTVFTKPETVELTIVMDEGQVMWWFEVETREGIWSGGEGKERKVLPDCHRQAREMAPSQRQLGSAPHWKERTFQGRTVRKTGKVGVGGGY